MKCSFDISNFLEEIPSLSHSVVFLYFFALITEEGFLMCKYQSQSPSLFQTFFSRLPYSLSIYFKMCVKFFSTMMICERFTTQEYFS